MTSAPPKLPDPILREREPDLEVLTSLLDQRADPWIAQFLARRLDQPVNLVDLTNPSLAMVADPSSIPSMDRAVERIVKAIQGNERVVFACDHDMDGTGSAAVLWTAFTQYFGVAPDRLHVVTSHRLTEGYGITEPVVRRILELRPALVITADKGSSDQERIALLAAAGIDVIVTDHHQIPAEGTPRSAYAVVNPTRADSRYDANICGAGVAFLTMAKVRTALLKAGWRPEIASLVGLLDLVAVATIADCVTLLPTKSYANRVFVKRGLELINQRRRPCWLVFAEELGRTVDADSVAFRLAPAVAAAGRLDWADAGFRFLTSSSVEDARRYWSILRQENELRKRIEQDLRERAFMMASAIKRNSLVLFLQDGHAGVHGITASRLVEAFGKPAAVFSPKGAGARVLGDSSAVAENGERIATGSFRGVPGLDVRLAIERVAEASPGAVISFGGHAAAAGATLMVDDLERFAVAYESAVVEQLGSAPLRPVLWTDGEALEMNRTLEAVDLLDIYGPFGRGFERPLYQGRFVISEYRQVGEGKHVRLSVDQGGMKLEAIWFGAGNNAEAKEMRIGDVVFLAYHLDANVFRGRRSLQAIVRYGRRHANEPCS